MSDLITPFTADRYETPDRQVGCFARLLPSLAFYPRAINTVLRSSRQARAGSYDTNDWARSSVEIVESLESVGCRLEVSGLENLEAVDRPAVFIGNHMSTLETFVLPSIIVSRCDNLTFVVKRSLTEYPVFKHVMLSRNPVVVDRVNPRDDLKAVMEQGVARLADGCSVAIFPQHTRSIDFDPEQFNTIGIKLAIKAGAPVVPVALKTWAWSPGSLLKDYGPIIPSRTIHFAFGAPIEVEGRGQAEHQQVVQFIQEHLERWE
jgi:1-acyl-sn-glycerol-3-phosphate acyltransferase